MKLTRLKINKLENVAPTELRFSAKWNVLLGPNGTGKTTLLEVVSTLLRTVAFPNDFDLDLDMLSGEDEFAVHIEGARTAIAAATSSGEVVGPGLRGELRTVRGPSGRMTFRKVDDLLEWKGEGPGFPEDEGRVPWRGSSLAWLLLSLPTDHRTAPWIQKNALRFDESLEFFAQVFQQAEGPAKPQIILRPIPDGVRSELHGVVSRSLESAANHAFGASERTRIDVPAEKLPFLQDFRRACGMSSAEMLLLATGNAKGPKRDGVGFEIHLCLFYDPTGLNYPHTMLSYGQKRFLAFLYYLEANAEIVIADELVNGLHHAWINLCMEKLEQRQSFLTSQNPLLLDYLHFESAEEVRATFILTSRDSEGRFVWRNMDEGQAQRFYEAYKVGFESVNEILRAEGLW